MKNISKLLTLLGWLGRVYTVNPFCFFSPQTASAPFFYPFFRYFFTHNLNRLDFLQPASEPTWRPWYSWNVIVSRTWRSGIL